MKAVFGWEWDFAVRCQGHGGDYRGFLPPGTLPADKAHYIMLKAASLEALQKLRSLDFVTLSQSQTITPGFGATDVVAAYSAL